MAKISSARDGGVIEASLESYGAERSEAVGDTDATANVVFRLTPRLGQCPMASRISRAMSTACSARLLSSLM